ncbi:unnamed protein product [Rotaria sordida]|uniref:Uncharacterized protein n=1 Tax=Rotaria sordida TaxID=392033 RepID=A0A813Y2C3_9BILA|nr:unnamed protein product [Rotaria sordida]CAF0879683.1 unnamed protein product [Rotaria sordida]
MQGIRQNVFIEWFSNDSKKYIRSLSIHRNPPPVERFNDNNRPPLRHPVLDNDSYILIALVILMPIILTLIVCIIICCVYRYNKRQSQRNITNLSIKPTDYNQAPASTIYFNPYHKPFIVEESPPSYDLISKTKNNDNNNNNNTNE